MLTKEQKDEFIKKLKELSDDSDTENSHITADNILCMILRLLDCDEIVEEYDKISKWYA
jgi:hypothetical protein